MPIENNLAELELIVPNLHRRYSGVTATNRMVAPKLAARLRAAWFGSAAPENIARLRVADLAKLWRRDKPLIWHARRNNDMIDIAHVARQVVQHQTTFRHQSVELHSGYAFGEQSVARLLASARMALVFPETIGEEDRPKSNEDHFKAGKANASPVDAHRCPDKE